MGSERDFAYHYAAYTLGVAGGSALAGVAVGMLRWAGADEALAVRLSYAVGAVAMLAALALWRPERRGAERPPARSHRPDAPPCAVAMQLPDLLLVSALALMLPLVPLVLVRQFHLAPLVVGLDVRGVQGGKVGGSSDGRGSRAGSTATGSRSSVLLAIRRRAEPPALGVDEPRGRAALRRSCLIATAFVTTGGVAAHRRFRLARTAPSHRPGATVTWNVCEYGVIAAMTATSGWLLASFHRPELLFTLRGAACSPHRLWPRRSCSPARLRTRPRRRGGAGAVREPADGHDRRQVDRRRARREHLRAGRRQLAAVADIDGGAPADWPLRRARPPTTTGQEMLDAEQLDAVAVCTPPLAHRDPCLAAVERGLGVYLEKPSPARMRMPTRSPRPSAPRGPSSRSGTSTGRSTSSPISVRPSRATRSACSPPTASARPPDGRGS